MNPAALALHPEIAPVSCCGKKPFGILTISTTLSAMVSEEHDEGEGRIGRAPSAGCAGTSDSTHSKNRSLAT